VARTSIEVRLADHPEVRAILEDLQMEIEELRQDRDFWENEYNELLATIGGVDPRHD